MIFVMIWKKMVQFTGQECAKLRIPWERDSEMRGDFCEAKL